MKEILTIEQLYEFLYLNKEKLIEASRVSNTGAMRATHLFSVSESSVFDEGIGGEETEWEKEEFIEWYKNSKWIIDEIIN